MTMVQGILDGMERDAEELLAGKGYPMTPTRFKCICEELAEAAKQDGELLKANIARVRELEGMLGGAANTLLGCAIRQKKSEAEAANVAKLRAAVKDVLDHAAFATEHATMLTDGTPLLDRIRAAYLAPARNCDRFTTLDDAVREYLHLAANAKLPEDQAKSIATWLFARAPEKDGAE